MKKPQEHLWRLIHTLTPAEKRYFRRHFAPAEGQLLALYEALNAQPDHPDESALRLALKLSPSQFKVVKTQLLDLLLLSLRACHDKKGVILRIRAGLTEADLLEERQLFDLALARLRRIKQWCLDYEEHVYLLEVIEREFRISHLHLDNIRFLQADFWREGHQILSNLNSHWKLRTLGATLMEEHRTARKGSEQQWAKLWSELTAIQADTLDFRSKLSLYSNLQLLSALEDRPSQAAHYKKAMVALFDNNPHLQETNQLAYLGVLRNYANELARQQDLPAMETLLQRVNLFVRAYPAFEPHLLHFYLAATQVFLSQGNWSALLDGKLPRQIDDLVDKFALQSDRVSGLLRSLLAAANLFAGRHKEALRQLRLFQLAAAKIERQNQLLAFVQELLVFYEAGDPDIVSQRLNAERRRRKSLLKEVDSDLLNAHIHLLERWVSGKAGFRVAAQQLWQKLPTYAQDVCYSTYSAIQLGHWLEAVALGRSLVDHLHQPGQ